MVVWPQSLIHEIAERRVVFFIGAGLSKAALPTLPTWNQLLNSLAQGLSKKKDCTLVGQLVRQGRMLDAAQIVTDGLARADLNRTMRDTFQVRPIPNHTVYQDILMMDPKTLVTTNYDEFLEKNMEHYSAGNAVHSICKHGSTHLLTDLRSPVRSIVKMHGCITDPSDLVLDRASYFNARSHNPGIFRTLEALMTVNTVLFLGYSVTDPDIQLILENINIHAKSQHPHYALMSKFDHTSIRNALGETYNINFLEYAGDHSQVPGIINDLRNGVRDLRAARGIV